MSYATYDFTESLERVGIEPPTIARVVSAWGKGDGQGDDAGHYKWAEDGVTDWAGGFLMLLNDGRYAYLTGWCDYTGWGCQDGAVVIYFDHEPTVAEMQDAEANESKNEPEESVWDREPADLNRWLASAARPKEPNT